MTKDAEELHNDKKSKSQKHIVISKLNSKSTLLLNLAEKKERILWLHKGSCGKEWYFSAGHTKAHKNSYVLRQLEAYFGESSAVLSNGGAYLFFFLLKKKPL